MEMELYRLTNKQWDYLTTHKLDIFKDMSLTIDIVCSRWEYTEKDKTEINERIIRFHNLTKL